MRKENTLNVTAFTRGPFDMGDKRKTYNCDGIKAFYASVGHEKSTNFVENVLSKCFSTCQQHTRRLDIFIHIQPNPTS